MEGRIECADRGVLPLADHHGNAAVVQRHLPGVFGRHAQQARQAQAAWKEFWDVACALAAENREQLRERMQGQEPTARRRKANG